MKSILYNRNLAPALVFLGAFFSIFVVNLLAPDYAIVGDDAWGATAVLGNPFDVVIFTLRWDVHPPIFYLLLDIWALINEGDVWLTSFSTFCHASLVTLIFIHARDRFGLFYGGISALLVFSSPFLLDYSTRIRMYSLLALLSFMQFLLVNLYLKTRKKSHLAWLLLNGFAMSNCHAIGIVFVFFHYVYGVFGIGSLKKLLDWSLYHLIIFALALPAVANSLFRSVSHALAPDINAIVSLLLDLFVSSETYLSLLPLGLVLFSLQYGRCRSLVISYLLLPVITLAIVSIAVSPVWLARNFIPFIPMIYIALFEVIRTTNVDKRIVALVCCLFALINLANFEIYDLKNSKSPMRLSQITDFKKDVLNNGRRSCVLSKATLGGFWSLQRYLVGVRWADPIKVQPPLSQTWVKIDKSLPDIAREFLALNSYPNYYIYKNLVLVSGLSGAVCEEHQVDDIYIVSEDSITKLNMF